MRKLWLCTMALCLGLVSSTNAATSVTKFKVKGNTVSGLAEQGDPDTCFFAGLSVTASDETTKDGTGSTTARTLVINYTGRDFCNLLSFGGFSTNPLTVPITGNTVTFPFDLTVNYVNTDTGASSQRRLVGTVTFTASGDFDKSRETTITQNESMRVIARTKGNARDANITVSATLDGVTQAFDPSTGVMGNMKSGTVEITRY
jgi:hypothetical protein